MHHSPLTIRAASRLRSLGAPAATGAILASALAASCVIPLSTTTIGAGADGGPSSALEAAASGADVTIPTGHWNNVTGVLANYPSTCGNLTLISAKPDEDVVFAGVAAVGLWASRSGGPWQLIGQGSDASAPVDNRPFAIVYDPANSTRFWVSGSYGGCVFETNDDGNTFVQLGSAIDCDLVSIDFSDPNRQTIVAGAHEQPATLNRSTDGGLTWTNVGAQLPSNANCSMPLVIDAMTHLVGCSAGGIYRTTDGGTNWTQATTSGGILTPLVASDGSIYWLSYDGTLTRSTDNGQTWNDITSSVTLSSTEGRLIELPNGDLAAIANQSVVVSSDQGATWNPATSALPVDPPEFMNGLAYSSQRQSFYVWNSTCQDPVPADAVEQYDFAIQTD